MKDKEQRRHLTLYDKGNGLFVEWVDAANRGSDEVLGSGFVEGAENDARDYSINIKLRHSFKGLFKGITTKTIRCFNSSDYDMWSKAFGLPGLM